ncbi:hypothetical protein [Stutzerimonas stutzeri]|jgi:hypothetical protein|uniref:hypothetical protein n=1 Tax=Stutzerimonas stutzeri TaxID=316 RepID=UPI00066B8489|nr:hypothetical protein [Stutzerimonas stutzeri]RRV80352.1 hypothetical protein EGI92_12240 [Stutzerimonas stutzeri]
MTQNISISTFEDLVFEVEQVRIVVRGNPRDLVQDYGYERKAAGNTSVTGWLETRVYPALEGKYSVAVVDGSGAIPHGRTHMSKLRGSYLVE